MESTLKSERLKSFREVVDHYIAYGRRHARNELRWFSQPPLDDAITRAAMAVINKEGNRHPHQWRRSAPTLKAFGNSLRRQISTIRNAKTFHELHEIVWQCGEGIHDIGPLTVYDTAHRIGGCLGLAPDRVYLHSGTRDGARAVGLGGRESIAVSDLPKEFQRLTPAEVEDCLCIYKHQLRAIARGVSLRDAASANCVPKVRRTARC